MDKGFEAIPTAEGWQLSNAPVLSMAAHKAALDIFSEAGMNRLHAKRLLLNNYLWYLLDEIIDGSQRENIKIITPREEVARGCQVSILLIERGREIYDGLMKEGIMVDWREPSTIRMAPVPLYNTFEEVWKFFRVFRNLV